jgi:hypothetical protein
MIKYCAKCGQRMSNIAKCSTCLKCNTIPCILCGKTIGAHAKKCKSCESKTRIRTKEWNNKIRDSQLGSRNSNWMPNGSKYLTTKGYTKIKINDTYIFEHRFVLEKYIKLSSKNEVHHINGIRTDNRVENLMVFKDKSSHTAWHNNHMSVKLENILFDGRTLKEVYYV